MIRLRYLKRAGRRMSRRFSSVWMLRPNFSRTSSKSRGNEPSSPNMIQQPGETSSNQKSMRTQIPNISKAEEISHTRSDNNCTRTMKPPKIRSSRWGKTSLTISNICAERRPKRTLRAINWFWMPGGQPSQICSISLTLIRTARYLLPILIWAPCHLRS